MSSETDATDISVLKFLKSSKHEDNSGTAVESKKRKACFPSIPHVPMDSDYYAMSRHRKTAIIFNHYRFDDINLNKREGTEKDCKDLETVLKSISFDVHIYNDLKYGDIYDVICSVASGDHSDSDCLLICVMSHGEKEKIHARDYPYSVDILLTPFAGDKCPTLAGKPKIFLIQACRGEDIDSGAMVRKQIVETEAPNVYKIPAMADFIVMYSTYDGYYSWRSPITGSWFIQSVCEEFKKRTKTQDLLTILTFVNRRVALGYQSNVPHKISMHEKKQIGTVVSTLTRLLYFYPDFYEKME